MFKTKSEFTYDHVQEVLDHAWDYFYEYLADNLDNTTAMNTMASLNTKDVYNSVKDCLLDNVKIDIGREDDE
jgi:hypothetical protein